MRVYIDWGQRGIKFDMTKPKYFRKTSRNNNTTEMDIAMRGEFLKGPFINMLAHMSLAARVHKWAWKILVTQPDLTSPMATTIKITLSDIAIFLSLHTPVSTHSDSLVLNVERAAGPDHQIMLTFHRVRDEQEKWVHDTYFILHTE